MGLPIVRIQNLTGTNEGYNYYEGKYPSQVEINNGDILISWSASLGVYLWNGGKAILNQHIFKVDFNKLPVDKDYFMVAVSQKLAEMGDKTHGATMKFGKEMCDKWILEIRNLCCQTYLTLRQ